ncbi:MAG: class I SAM-dependent methyltransferase [Bacillota bacterium]|nr:class I SAM-dependent methyltransferase [Bacillota bacterium]
MYKWDAQDYKKNSSEQQKWAQELIDKLSLNGNENILDIGCGDGKVTSELAARVQKGSVLGIDSSEDMIQLAKKLFPSYAYHNLCFQLMPAERLDFTEQFDVVFSNAALHWVKDHQPVLQGINKALNRGGKILLQMGGKGNASNLIKVLDQLIQSEKWKKYFTNFSFPYGFYSDKEYEQWVTACGLKIKRIELIPKDMVHDGPAGLAAWVRTTWLPYTARVEANRRDEFIEEIVTGYVQENPLDSKGLVHVEMIRLEVEAYKIL